MPRPSSSVVLLAAALSLARCDRAASLAAPSSATNENGRIRHSLGPSKDRDGDTSSPSNRVFVAGISPSSDESSLRAAFSDFGTVRKIAIIGRDDDDTGRRKRAPFCFVTFDDEASVQRALASPGPTDLYQKIEQALPVDARWRSNRSRGKEVERLERIQAFAAANLILQVQSTHLDRLTAHLHRGDYCKVLGPADSNSKNVSLLFLSCRNPGDMARKLSSNPLLARAINKSYAVQPGLLEGNLSTKEGCQDVAEVICNHITRDKDVASVRMNVYPPKDLQRLLRSLETVVDESVASSQQFTINPKRFSHILSVVEVYRYKGRGWETKQNDENSRRYMMGISLASPELDVLDINNILFDDSSGGEVSRAYFKLKEAMETYEDVRGKLPEGLEGAIALDCGSAPGGWTKYLIERFHCRRVYSIDPGSLSPSVSGLKEAMHMQMKVQGALPILLSDETVKGKVRIFVSDMCLHKMSEQIDQLLLAREQGLLAPDAFFVLTLKCTMGHSKASYDAQVDEVVERLLAEATVEGAETCHLFSNRSGERTVMGRIS
ncbi:hypothetical protein ACHAXT_011955 [Thalassiosira profunda]